MRISLTRWAVAAATAAVLMTGCQTGSNYNRFSMRNFWPWGKKDKAAEAALASSATQMPQLPSQTAAANAGTAGLNGMGATYPEVAANNNQYPVTAYSDTNTQVSYPSNAVGQGGGQSVSTAGQGGNLPAYENYGGAVASNYNGANPSGGYDPGAQAGVSPQAGPYDARSNPYAGQGQGATPTEYTVPEDASTDQRYSEYQSPAGQDNSTGSRYGDPAVNGYPAGSSDPYQPQTNYRSDQPDYQSGQPGYQPTEYQPGPTDVQPEQSNYRPGDTGYLPGRTGYNPAGVPPYESPADNAAPANENRQPHYRPGGTSDYRRTSSTGQGATSPSLLVPPNSATRLDSSRDRYGNAPASDSYGAGSYGGTYQP